MNCSKKLDIIWGIFQDSENLLWIVTWDGLNRYNGNSFKIFRPELNNENSLKPNNP